MTEKPDKTDLEFLLSEYLDGGLSRRERLDLERRLQGDPALREQLQGYVGLEGRLAEMALVAPGDVDYDAQRAEIMAAVERKMLLEARPRRPWILRPVWMAPLAAAAVLVVAVTATIVMRTPPAAPKPQEVAVARLLPPLGGGADGVVQVEFPRPAGQRTPPTEDDSADDLLRSTSEGTVMISLKADADGMDDIPIWIQ